MLRYIILFLSAFVGYILNTGFSVNMGILSFQFDFMLIIMLNMVYFEKTLTPVFYMAGAAVVMDLLFSPAFGFYTLQYIFTGFFYYMYISSNKQMTYVFFAANGICFFVKEILGILLCLLSDNPVGFFSRILTSSLPGAFLQIFMAIPFYFLFKFLYGNLSIKPISMRREF